MPLLRQLPAALMRDIVSPKTPGDRSKQLFSVISRLARLAISPDTIERIIRAHPAGIGEKYVNRADLDKEIARVVAKQNGAPESRPPGQEWKDALIVTSAGNPTGCVANAITALCRSPAWQACSVSTSSNNRSSRWPNHPYRIPNRASGSVITISRPRIGYSAKAFRWHRSRLAKPSHTLRIVMNFIQCGIIWHLSPGIGCRESTPSPLRVWALKIRPTIAPSVPGSLLDSCGASKSRVQTRLRHHPRGPARTGQILRPSGPHAKS
jgi:hypothetical protein